MVAAVAASKTNQAAASVSSDNAIMPPAKLVDPQLLMAARRGDSKRLEELLQVDMAQLKVESSVASEAVILVEVSPERPPAPATPPPPPLDDDGVTSEGDTLLHVLAECGDSKEFTLCATMIIQHKLKKHVSGGAAAVRLALEARNSKGDTPLHRAASAGNANMIGCLLDLVANTADDGEGAGAAAKKALVRTQNKCREAALHQPVRATRDKKACIDQLMAVDPELACTPLEDGGASPLYLAISLGEIKIAEHLYVKSKGKLSYSGPDGRNVLHAAISRQQALPMILEWLKVDGMQEAAAVQDQGEQLGLSQLTNQRDKQQKGSTPLHLAASLRGWSTARLLLDANESTAYQADDEGGYPIHVAAWSGSLGVVKLLLGRCPDCATLRDGKGRTFLHVATKREHLALVRYVCGEIPQRLSSMILNVQDSNGDTALHGAVRAGNLAVFECLFQNQRVRLDLANKDGMTPIDLSYATTPAGFHYDFNQRRIVHMLLSIVGAPSGVGRPDFFTEKHLPKRDVDKESKKLTEATQLMSVVTALIATVTFASAFTLPGGYRADGQPVLAGSYAFDAFILADTLAFICSILATCTLVYAGFPAMDIDIRHWYLVLSVFLLQSAVRSLVAAFGLGLYLVVHHTASAIAACVIVFASSIYGNKEVRRMIRMAITVRTRIGIPRNAAVTFLKVQIFVLSVHFGSYAIIFGLPAIRKRVHQD